MNTKELLKKLKGLQTIESIMSILNINRKKAIYHIHRLRKKGYVKTKRLSNKKRVYNISFENKLNGKSYEEIINQHSPIKIVTAELYKIYGKNLSLEETLVYAIKTQRFRTILASLALFGKIHNWSKLYQLAKKNNIKREVGVLYDVARQIIPVRKMAKRYLNNSLPQKGAKWEYIIPELKSEDFREIEKKWKIYIPFNKKDLEDYKK